MKRLLAMVLCLCMLAPVWAAAEALESAGSLPEAATEAAATGTTETEAAETDTAETETTETEVRESAGGWLEAAGNWLETAWGEASAWAGQAWKDSEAWVRENWGEASEWASQAWQDSEAWIRESWGAVSDWAGQAWKDSEAWIRETWGQSSEWVSRVWNDSSAWVKEIWGGVSAWAADSYQAVSEKVRAWWQERFLQAEKIDEAWQQEDPEGEAFGEIRELLAEYRIAGAEAGTENEAEVTAHDLILYLMQQYQLGEANIGRIFETVQAYSAQKGISAEAAEAIMLPYLLQLARDYEPMIGKIEIPAAAVAQYLTGTFEKLGVETEEDAQALAERVRKILRKDV